MAKRRKKNKYYVLLLFLIFLISILILLILLFIKEQKSLFFLSNKTIDIIDSSFDKVENKDILLHIEQVNYFRNKPYKYVYKKIKIYRDINEIKKEWEKKLKRLHFVRIQYLKKYYDNNNIVYNIKIGTSKFIFYQLDLIYSKSAYTYEDVPDIIDINKPKKNKSEVKAKIAIIIDDVGAEPLSLTKKFLSFPEKMTFAVFPLLKTTKDRVERIRKIKRFSIILHQPMEPENYKERGIPLAKGEILTNMTEKEIINVLNNNFKSVLYAIGINNHQGSGGTQSERVMTIVVKYLKMKNYFFIDSYTTAKSVGYKIADKYDLPYNKRDVFLDNINTEEYVQKQFDKLISIALQKKEAIGIGHMTKKSTINVLLKNIKKVKEKGIEFVLVKDLLIRKQEL